MGEAPDGGGEQGPLVDVEAQLALQAVRAETAAGASALRTGAPAAQPL